MRLVRLRSSFRVFVSGRETGVYSIAISLDCRSHRSQSPPAKLDDGYEGWVDGRDALTIPSLI